MLNDKNFFHDSSSLFHFIKSGLPGFFAKIKRTFFKILSSLFSLFRQKEHKSSFIALFWILWIANERDHLLHRFKPSPLMQIFLYSVEYEDIRVSLLQNIVFCDLEQPGAISLSAKGWIGKEVS